MAAKLGSVVTYHEGLPLNYVTTSYMTLSSRGYSKSRRKLKIYLRYQNFCGHQT